MERQGGAEREDGITVGIAEQGEGKGREGKGKDGGEGGGVGGTVGME
jgi:hypothetical protein